MTAVIGWTAATLAGAALAGIVGCIVAIARHDCCDHPDLDDVELVLP